MGQQRSYYTRVVVGAVRFLHTTTGWVMDALALVAFVVIVANQEIADALFNFHGISQWWAMAPIVGLLTSALLRSGYDEYARVVTSANPPGRRELIKATTSSGQSLSPTGRGDTVWESFAYLDVETTDEQEPLRNCRVKLLELQSRLAWTEKATQEVHSSWNRDAFYNGKTYFFCWSGRPDTVEAIDIHKMERATIARQIDTVPAFTTTAGAAGHLFHGDQYHLTVEITADNSLPLVKDYWLQMRQLSSGDSLIEDWDANPR